MKAIKTISLGSLLLAGLMAAGLVQAQFTIYTDRPTFETDNPGLDTEDFEQGSPQGPGGVCAFDGPLDETGDGICFSSGDLLGSVVYDSSGETSPNMVRLGPGIVANPSNVIASNFFVDATSMQFSNPSNLAVGFELQCTSNSGATVDIYDAGGLVTSEQATCDSVTPAFFGISNIAAITQVVVSGNSGNGEVIDNVSFGASAPAEPSPVARFAVTKDFSDNNSKDVIVHISCNTGLPLEQSFKITDSQSDPGGTFAPPQAGVIFVVKSFADGAMDCTITEIAVDGYEADYTAGGASASVDNDPDAPGCHFSAINFEDVNTCEVSNTLESVSYTVTKAWEFDQGLDGIEQAVRVDITCENYREAPDGDLTSNTESELLDSGDPSVSFDIYPNFTTPVTRCRAVETITASGVDSDQGCEDWKIIPVDGEDVSCTITNTVFFEGIPTLSQYGLAILVLLTLGVGLIGFRRMI